jgi:hypothetical protein
MTTPAKAARPEPLVPAEVQRRGTALEIALEAVAKLGSIRRPRAPVLHRKVHPKACSGRYNGE